MRSLTLIATAMVAAPGSIRRRDMLRRALESPPFLISPASEELLSLCDIALTHDSYVNEERDRTGIAMADNERLEFLGDAVLELTVREHLFMSTVCKEGELTLRLQGLISNSSLAARLRDLPLDLEALVLTGEGHRGLSDRMLAGAFEALMGAIYITEGLEAARKVCLRAVIP